MRYYFSFLTVVLYLSAGSAFAQFGSATPAAEGKPAVVDTFNRLTPRSMVEGYLRAIGEGDYEKASRYIDTSNHPLGDRPRLAKELAEQLRQLLDRDGYFYEAVQLSGAPEGNLSDELDASLEQVGVLNRSSRIVPLLLTRVKNSEDVLVWKVAPETLKRVPFLLQVSKEGWLDQLLPQQLKAYKIGTVSAGHWLAVAVAALLCLLIGLAISWLITSFIRRMLEKRSDIPGRGIIKSLLIPLGVVIGVSLYRIVVLNLGVQVVARENINWIATILSLVAFAWLIMRIVDGISEVIRYSMSRTNRLSSIAVVMLARRIVKTAIFAIAIIAILNILGFDLTAGLAALGIGGLALAFGAQKTIENLVGSVTVVADKPVRVGDFCQFAGVMGTVEDIGIRSTRLRTLDRTIVTIPNGAFAATEIENYTLRDRFLFRHTLNLRYETTPAQMRFVLFELRKMLYAHEHVINEAPRARFIALNAHSLDIEMFAYVKTNDINAFLEIQEDLLLRSMEVVEESGAGFAFPSQTLYLGKDELPSDATVKKINKDIEKMMAQDELSLRQFSKEQIKDLSGTIKLPLK